MRQHFLLRISEPSLGSFRCFDGILMMPQLCIAAERPDLRPLFYSMNERSSRLADKICSPASFRLRALPSQPVQSHLSGLISPTYVPLIFVTGTGRVSHSAMKVEQRRERKGRSWPSLFISALNISARAAAVSSHIDSSGCASRLSSTAGETPDGGTHPWKSFCCGEPTGQRPRRSHSVCFRSSLARSTTTITRARLAACRCWCLLSMDCGYAGALQPVAKRGSTGAERYRSKACQRAGLALAPRSPALSSICVCAASTR